MKNRSRNVHDYFGAGNTFVLIGIAVVSLLLLVKTIFLTPPEFVSSQGLAAAAFFVAGAVAVAALVSPHVAGRFNFYRDGLPFLAFPMALIIAGSRSNVTWVILAIATLATFIFMAANGKGDEIDDDKHIVRYYFRWPF